MRRRCVGEETQDATSTLEIRKGPCRSVRLDDRLDPIDPESIVRVSPSLAERTRSLSRLDLGLIYREQRDIRPTFFLSIDSRPTIRKISSARPSSVRSGSPFCVFKLKRVSVWHTPIARVEAIFRVELERSDNRANAGSDRGGKEEHSHKRSDCIPSRRVADDSG